MIQPKASVLIVDDESSVRQSMTQILAEIGYRVRSAEDGAAALAEIRREAPEILISDLNMPGMSGFELVPVVRRRFPRIQIVVMSGNFSAGEVPSDVSADAFYPKGGSVVYLMGILESFASKQRADRMPLVAVPPPIWIADNGHNIAGEPYVTIECPECLKTFPKVLNGTVGLSCKTDCVYCRRPIRYSVLRTEDLPPSTPVQHRQSTAAPRYRFNRKHLRRNSAESN
jgi:CheY-like chemotaxis protein